ncbi:MAG: extracellular solute-binding protein [bacterium]|nr:extracellular solute-binding protein [bacterium]
MQGNFKIILIIVFIVCAVIAIMVFAGVIPLGDKKVESTLTGNVVLWGTVKAGSLEPLVTQFNFYNKSLKLIYVEKYAETFDQDLLEALAEGKGPDLFLLPDNLAYTYSNKIYTVPYASYPQLDFKNYFAGGTEVFLTNKGTLAFPLSIDPMVMYYNRSILDANNIVYPPVYWDEFSEMSSKITKRDEANQIVKSAVGFGQYSNVTNAKDIVTSLFMQMGSPIVKQVGNAFLSNIGEKDESKRLGDALSFYTSFADPFNPSYSWNKSFPNSQDAFSSETLAFYFGYASELSTLIKKNPNQNMGVAPLPQIKNSNTKAAKARIVGIAISSFSKNFNTAYGVAGLLSSGDFSRDFSRVLVLAPARRDLLAQKQQGLYLPTFYSSALISKSWLDPSPKDTEKIFRVMIESTLSNNVKAKDAVTDAGSRINLLLK